jgi:hypothetical protein
MEIYFNPETKKRIGISTAGDDEWQVMRGLGYLINKNKCDLCICGSRTHGSTNVVINNWKFYHKLYFPKTVSKTSQRSTNRRDAKSLLDVIEQLLK